MSYHHISVMLSETIDALNCRDGKIIVDCTLGGAGHAEAVCERISPSGLLIGIDQDIDSINNAKKKLSPYEHLVRLFHGNYVHLGDYLSTLGISGVDGILLDLGLSFHQIDQSGRGFSFRKNEPLDMRMDVRSSVTAEYLVNTLSKDELVYMFRTYGEEKWAGPIARRIEIKRKQKPIKTSLDLVQIILDAVPKRAQFRKKIHPATQVFMALRIAVNRELDVLANFLESAVRYLNPEGRLCILSFHSLEDRIVKRKINEWKDPCVCPSDFPECICKRHPLIKNLTSKVLKPTDEEIRRNPMSRSTKLRVVERL